MSEKEAELIVERLIRRVEKANIKYLEEVGKSIKQIKTLTPTEAHKLVQRLKYGDKYKEITNEIAKYSGMNINDIDEMFKVYSKKDTDFAEGFYKYRKKNFIPYAENLVLQRQTNALSRMVRNELYNYTRNNVLGYSFHEILPNGKRGKLIFSGLRDTYNTLLDQALINVGRGEQTFDQSMRGILSEIGGSGLRTINYESGRSLRLDSAIRMHLKGRLRELHNENQKVIGEEIDADGVEISVHENPAPDHMEVQGRQFKLKEFDKLQNGEDAKDYKGVVYNLDYDGKNGYRPISEMNCYHYVFSIILGISKPAYTDEELKKIKDRTNKEIEFEGKKYNMYECTQLQRSIEREIRRQKDIQIFGRASDNKEMIADSQSNITALTSKYNDLCKRSGLPKKMDRISVKGYHPIKIRTIEQFGKAKDEVLPVSNVNKVSSKELNGVKDNKYYNSSKIFRKSKEILDLSNNENINIYNATNNLNIKINERKGLKSARYVSRDKAVYVTGVDEKSIKPETTLWHELGHALDNNNLKDYKSNYLEMRMAMYDYYKNNRMIPQEVKDYFASFKEEAYKEYKEKVDFKYFHDNYMEIRKSEGANEYTMSRLKQWKEQFVDDYEGEIKREYENRQRKYYWDKRNVDIDYAQIANFSDMFSAISDGEYNKQMCGMYGYHTKSYFNRDKDNPTTELFANFVSLKMTGSERHLKFLKKQAPAIYKELEDVYKAIGDDLGVR